MFRICQFLQQISQELLKSTGILLWVQFLFILHNYFLIFRHHWDGLVHYLLYLIFEYLSHVLQNGQIPSAIRSQQIDGFGRFFSKLFILFCNLCYHGIGFGHVCGKLLYADFSLLPFPTIHQTWSLFTIVWYQELSICSLRLWDVLHLKVFFIFIRSFNILPL